MIDEKKLIEDLKQSGLIVGNDYGNAVVAMISNQPKAGAGEYPPLNLRMVERKEAAE